MENTDKKPAICVYCGESGGPMHRVYKTIFRRVQGSNHQLGICMPCSKKLSSIQTRTEIDKTTHFQLHQNSLHPEQ